MLCCNFLFLLFFPVPQNGTCTGRAACTAPAFDFTFFLTILEKCFGFLPKLSHVSLEDSSTLGSAVDSHGGDYDLQKSNSLAQCYVLHTHGHLLG